MAADCNCSNPSCPCYKGNQDKASEQQAPGPDAPSTRSTNGSTHGGPAMTVPNGGGNIMDAGQAPGSSPSRSRNSGGGDIMSVQDMRNHWQQAGTTAAGATDPLNSAASQLKELAARMEAVQAHAAQHGDETASQAAAAAETYRALAQKCDEAAAAVEPAVAGCAAAEQGLERFRPTEEALSSLSNRHEQTAAYVGS